MDSCIFAGITSVIALFALIYNNRQANYRETRKEIRVKLDQLNAALTTLLDSSKKYYLDKDASLIIENVKIHETINTCERFIEELSNLNDGISLKSDFYIVYDMITGGSFESKTHTTGDHHSTLCKKVSIQKESLITKAEDWFNKKYR
jgi:hypothetical protein